jgi:hypothetical protein
MQVRSWALRATNIRDGHHTEDILGTIKRLLIPQLVTLSILVVMVCI